MKKILRLRAQFLPILDKVQLSILEQSHNGNLFGESHYGMSAKFEASNGFSIMSMGSFLDTGYVDRKTDAVLFVPNITDAQEINDITHPVSIETYNRIKQAVLEYNSYNFKEV